MCMHIHNLLQSTPAGVETCGEGTLSPSAQPIAITRSNHPSSRVVDPAVIRSQVKDKTSESTWTPNLPPNRR